VDESRLLLGMAAVFAGTTVLFAMLGIVYSPVLLLVAALFGVVTYVLWTHGTGRLAARIYAQVQRQAATDAERARRRQRRRSREAGRARAGDGGFGAGPREDWEPPGDRRRQSGPRGRRRAGQRQRTEQRQRRDRAPRSSDRPTEAEAYRTLGLDPGADQQAIKQAYREKVKTVHPDTDGGDKEQFKDVKSAYERLVEE
jgi:hypothetical protein